jgi:bifunctional non-homologous end joining protein LigD
VAAPITWDELDAMERADAFSIGDAGELQPRARGKALKGWGFAHQRIPLIS